MGVLPAPAWLFFRAGGLGEQTHRRASKNLRRQTRRSCTTSVKTRQETQNTQTSVTALLCFGLLPWLRGKMSSKGGPELFVLTDQRHPLEVEASILPDVLECLLQHIIFHRALVGKAITPKDMVLLDDLFYVKCGDTSIDKQVRDSAQAACKALKTRDRGGSVTLTFFERVAGGLLGEKMVGPWEEWSVHVLVRTEPAFGHREELLRRKELEARVRELLWTVQKLVNSHRDHLPKEVFAPPLIAACIRSQSFPSFALSRPLAHHQPHSYPRAAGPQRCIIRVLPFRHQRSFEIQQRWHVCRYACMYGCVRLCACLCVGAHMVHLHHELDNSQRASTQSRVTVHTFVSR